MLRRSPRHGDDRRPDAEVVHAVVSVAGVVHVVDVRTAVDVVPVVAGAVDGDARVGGASPVRARVVPMPRHVGDADRDEVVGVRAHDLTGLARPVRDQRQLLSIGQLHRPLGGGARHHHARAGHEGREGEQRRHVRLVHGLPVESDPPELAHLGGHLDAGDDGARRVGRLEGRQLLPLTVTPDVDAPVLLVLPDRRRFVRLRRRRGTPAEVAAVDVAQGLDVVASEDVAASGERALQLEVAVDAELGFARTPHPGVALPRRAATTVEEVVVARAVEVADQILARADLRQQRLVHELALVDDVVSEALHTRGREHRCEHRGVERRVGEHRVHRRRPHDDREDAAGV